MKVAYSILFILLVLIGCKSKPNTDNTKLDNTIQKKETKMTTEEEKSPQDKGYTGIITEKDFKSQHLSEWFLPNYESYQPDQTIVEEIDKNIDAYKIKVFMGTWCSDSKRETPKLYKLLNLVNFNKKNLKIIATNTNKTTTQGYEKKYNIEYVPTIIFINKKGEEVNRVVEFPQESLEEDILKIVTHQPYKNSYAE